VPCWDKEQPDVTDGKRLMIGKLTEAMARLTAVPVLHERCRGRGAANLLMPGTGMIGVSMGYDCPLLGKQWIDKKIAIPAIVTFLPLDQEIRQYILH